VQSRLGAGIGPDKGAATGRALQKLVTTFSSVVILLHMLHQGVVALKASLYHAGDGAQTIANRRGRLLDCNQVWILVPCCSDGCGHGRFKLDMLRGRKDWVAEEVVLREFTPQ